MPEIMTDGRHDFDFLYGRWHIRNRRRIDPRDPVAPWREFDAHIEAYPILGGLGNIDVGRYDLDGSFEGLSVRLFEPATALWRIWWASTRRPGLMDPPVEGRFVDGRGEFGCHDTLDGEPVEVRFEWTRTSGDQPRWQQAFSFNGGHDWLVNWTMIFTREDGLRARSRSGRVVPACNPGPVVVLFRAELWRWDARRADSWIFVSLPVEASEEIRELAGGSRRGFGSARVRVTVGGSTWMTSIFPSSEGYVLPVKRAIRKAEALDVGDIATVTVELIDC